MKKHLIILTILIGLISCNQGKSIPNELIGTWIFDAEKAREEIQKSDRSEEEKKKLEETYINLVKDQTVTINSDGTFIPGSLPGMVKIKMEVIKKEGNKVYIKTTNSMNPDQPQYSLNYISPESWQLIEVDKNLKELNRAPSNYWKRSNGKL